MNSFGRIFKIDIFGESHGEMIGIGIDGIPVGIELQASDFKKDLVRRKPTKKGTTPRKESDFPIISAGVFKGKTTGAPLFVRFENKNIRPKDYSKLINTPRPGHSDFVAQQKYYGHNDYRGGGHFSGRLTLALVTAGVVAKKSFPNINISSKLIEAGGSSNIEQAVEAAITEGDSIGGIIECKCTNMPIGLGEPFFDSIESIISHLAFSIPAVKGIEFGSGFEAAKMKGSDHNDALINALGVTDSNNAGGINGGISNGNDLTFRLVIKPTSSISKTQMTYNNQIGKKVELEVRGRHDACIALRAPVIVEAIAAIALADFSLIRKSQG